LKELNINFSPIDVNLVDKIWKDKAAAPQNQVFIHDVKFSGCATSEKITKIRNLMDSKKCDAVVIGCLDQIAWILNLRGSDIKFNPLFISYLLIVFNSSNTDTFLYSDKGKFNSKEIENYLKENNIQLLPYDQIFGDLDKLKGRSIGIELDSVNAKLVQSINTTNNKMIDIQDCIPILKVLIY